MDRDEEHPSVHGGEKNEGQLQTGGPDGGLLTSAIHIKGGACSVGESCAIRRPACRRGQENWPGEALIGLIAAALRPSSSAGEREGGAHEGPRLNKVDLLTAGGGGELRGGLKSLKSRSRLHLR